jgi:heme/copper-type cytochrome/quinol oxidase subunit 1
MTTQHLELLAAVIGAIVAVGTLVFMAGRFTESVKANTKATESLSMVIDKHLTWSAEVVREHDERFHEHDTRITVLEKDKEARRR